MEAARRIFHDMVDYPKAVGVEQGMIFFRTKASVIERLTLQFADRAAFAGSAGKHEGGTRCGMRLKACEHGALIVWRKMEKAVPGKQTREFAVERKMSHVRKDRWPSRQIAPEQRQHLRRSIDTGDIEAAPDQFAGYWQT